MILGNASMLESHPQLPADAGRAQLEEIAEAAERAASLTVSCSPSAGARC